MHERALHKECVGELMHKVDSLKASCGKIAKLNRTGFISYTLVTKKVVSRRGKMSMC